MLYGIVRRIFALAERLEPDRKVVWEWVLHTPIEVLGGHTTIELIFADEGDRVVAFLKGVVCEEEARGGCRQTTLPSVSTEALSTNCHPIELKDCA
jgi:hypothetical protein